MTRGKITADYADLNGWFNANGMPSEVDKAQFFKLYQLYPRNPRF